MGLRKEKIATLEVKIGDIGYGNHMGNDKALLFFHDARIKMFNSIGFEELNIGNNTGIVVSEAHVYYYKEVFLYDVLEATLEVDEITPTSFFLNYEFTRQSDSKIVLKGSTKIIAFDYATKKVAKIPDEFLSKISK